MGEILFFAIGEKGCEKIGESDLADELLGCCPDCAGGKMDNAVPYTSDGPLGHGWECGTCGAFLQAG